VRGRGRGKGGGGGGKGESARVTLSKKAKSTHSQWKSAGSQLGVKIFNKVKT
jgi:hypothetical protein